jgi:hypothetical protein
MYKPCVLVSATLAAVFATIVTPRAHADVFTDTVAGIWAEPDCATGKRVKILNALGILDFVPVGSDIHLQVTTFSNAPTASATGVLQATVVNANIRQQFAIELPVENGRLNGTMERCADAPTAVQWIYGEAIAGFNGAGRALTICGGDAGPACLRSLFDVVDVTGDGSLSRAEVARLLRIGGFFAGYFAQPKALVASQEVLIPTAVAGAIGTVGAAAIIGNMDYDDDGRLSMEELLQDRGEGAGLEAAASALEPAAAQAILQSIAAALPGIAQMIGAYR